MSLQEALRQMRLELGITQTSLAQKLNKSFLTVNRWENAKGFPSRENARNILAIARGSVSDECYRYLYETLMPESKRSKSAALYGFPDIDRDFLFQLADASANALYVIDADSYELLYANRKAEQSAVAYLRESGENVAERFLSEQKNKRCFHYFGGRNSPCSFCPFNPNKRDEFTDKTIVIPETGRILHVHARFSKMKERSVYSVYLTDLTEKDADLHALYELTNDIPGGVGIYNVYRDARIELVFMNETFFKMIGAQRKEALLKDGHSDLCLIHPDDRPALYSEIQAALSENRRVDIALRMRVIDGKYHRLHLNGKHIRSDELKSTFYCLFSETE